ncbi:hypothetical protein EBR43_11425 [bacterium]|nr:hypothetical protein [bacterium]
MSLEKMLDEAKDLAELRVFSEAQQKTIVKLSKKNKELEDEISHLKKLLETTAPIISNNEAVPSVSADKFLTTDQEAICRMQLNRLKEVSYERELTLEEAKRVEIFSKIINVLENSPKTIKVETKNLDNKELLSLIEQDPS